MAGSLGIVARAGRWLAGLFGGGTGSGVAASGDSSEERAWSFVEEVMAENHFTHEARDWLRGNISLRIDDFSSTSGGGYWKPAIRQVHLFTAQHEAAVHELSHAWWQDRRRGQEERMMEAVVRLSAEADPRYAQTSRLAFGYVHGIPEQNWKGMLVERNDWEMFAGLASGTMGNMSLLPSYVRELYVGLFEMPDET